MKFITTLFVFLVLNLTNIVWAQTDPKPCLNFDNIALQLALTQAGMQSPLTIKQIETLLGPEISETNQTKTTYSWVHKNLILIVKTDGNDITDSMLTGFNDSDITSKKMEQIYSTLKVKTSIWYIKEIQSQLGPGRAVNNKVLHHTWACNLGSITLSTNQNNDITAAEINYQISSGTIEKRLGPNHPTWDIQTDSLGKSCRIWKRSFVTQ